MEQGAKRKAENVAADAPSTDKRLKSKKQWHSTIHKDKDSGHATAIRTGDAGIWATCPKGREGKCVAELRDLFEEYSNSLYRDAHVTNAEVEGDGEPDSIEKEVQDEIASMKKPRLTQLFTPVKLDVQCVVFFKTVAPVEPVALVQKICEDALNGKQRVRTRFTQRLTPMSMMGSASTESLEKTASQVLPTRFQGTAQKYAIRINMRNHNILKRDAVIQQIATLVGPSHPVDLQHYDLLILVEAYKNICGISIVTNAFETLKRFNLMELNADRSRSVAVAAETDAADAQGT